MLVRVEVQVQKMGTDFPYAKGNMGVSENNGTPKSSILIRCSIINHPFWGTLIFGNIHMMTMSWWDSMTYDISGILSHPWLQWLVSIMFLGWLFNQQTLSPPCWAWKIIVAQHHLGKSFGVSITTWWFIPPFWRRLFCWWAYFFR